MHWTERKGTTRKALHVIIISTFVRYKYNELSNWIVFAIKYSKKIRKTDPENVNASISKFPKKNLVYIS